MLTELRSACTFMMLGAPAPLCIQPRQQAWKKASLAPIILSATVGITMMWKPDTTISKADTTIPTGEDS